MNILTKEVLLGVSMFSDWRLYADNGAKSCALEGLSLIRQPNSEDKQRAWLPYQNLSDLMREFCDLLTAECIKLSQPWRCFNVDFTDGESHIRFRIQEMGKFFACKRILTSPPNLDELAGVPDSVKAAVTSASLRLTGGLVLMVGDTGTGKTMFASAALRERLKKFGGYCLVLADPPEQPLGDDGGHYVGTNGYVDEVDVSDIGYTQALEHSLRSFPVGKTGSLFYGEIRSDSNAFDLISASCDGHEVFSTMHAMSPDAALERLISWCVRGGIPVDVVRSMLAQSLFCIIWHRVEYGRFISAAYLVSEITKQRIREGHALPIKSTSAQTIAPMANVQKLTRT
jgi:Tfp pilus assembly pilus retraction ATPase PilT